jgi:hypothetical protein
MNKYRFSLLMFVVVFFSCSRDDLKPLYDDPILGIWTYSDYRENTAVFNRSESFSDNHCYNFKPDGTLIERKNSGWCGTPPINYENYNGTWASVNDTVILINVGFWGGTTSYYLDIETVNAEKLECIFVPGSQ